MTEQYRIWFEQLVKDREDSAKTLEKPSMRGIKNSVVEKYSDQAHFIYELLQNADDAKATKSAFQLTPDGLYFKHNGKTGFSVSNPDTEDEDKEKNLLGHINSITAIANSNKKESSIGKFGVGFKAVFQYTETPHIYDPNFQFKIRFIVPAKLETDLPDRKKDETVFYFPFDKKEMPKEKAYEDILGKLKKLIYPTLFLSNLQEVKWKTENEMGEYTKKSTLSKQWNDITYEKLELYQQIGLEQIKEKLFLFTRFIGGQNHAYSIGYFLDEKGKLIPKPFSAFCFFPTKQATNLNFILHAPFLLTDNRERIKEGQTNGWNEDLIAKLAQLAAESLLILKDLKLIDDDIIKIIPYKGSDFYTNSSYHPNSTFPKFFSPFFDKIKNKLQNDELIPASNGEYVNSKNAYWASAPSLPQLFSNEQLALLYENINAKWIFPSLGYNNVQGTDKELASYISDLSNNSQVSPNTILGKINYKFTENQEFEWLLRLYEYLSENNSYQDIVKTKPIFKDSKGDATFAFNYDNSSKKHELVLFLPEENDETIAQEASFYKTVHPLLLKNEKSREFIENFGIKKPSLKDEIYNHILPLYKKDGEIDTDTHFKKFFKYWKDEGRPEDFINLIKDKEFVAYKTKVDETTYRGNANTIYYPFLDLQGYFAPKPDTRFVDLEDYHKFIEEKDRQILKEFLLKIGVSELPRILNREITDWNEKNKLKAENGETIKSGTYGYEGQGTFDKWIDGCSEILDNVNKEQSDNLWTILILFSQKRHNFKQELTGEHKYVYYSKQRYQYFESTALTRLKTTKWLISTANEFVAPYEITINELAEGYVKNSDLESLLGFKPSVVLTEAQRIAQKFENEEQAEFAKRLLEEFYAKQNASHTNSNNGVGRSMSGNSSNPESVFENDDDNENIEQTNTSKIDRTIKDLDGLQKAFTPKEKTIKNKNAEPETQPEINFDEDEEFAKGIEDLKKQLEIKKSRIDLAENINKNEKYSYEWFKAYLKLLTTYGEKQNTTTQKSISFQEIKPYKADNKYFLLCGANKYISPEIENAEDFKVSLVFSNGKKENVTVEGVSKKGQDLLIFCRESLPTNKLSRLSNILKVEINFTPVIDLLDRLYKAFTNSNYIDEWQDINEAIPSLNYIYGPPGTGKTTTLCKNINAILTNNPCAKFLILTPTNKAADVVCKKMWDINSDIFAVRLSRPTDPELEEEAIYRDVLNDEDLKSINVVASTIHRLPYFDIQNAGFLFQYPWDYVIFDESSMAGLHYITFAIMALYKYNPSTHFIIAGDPKQIPPVIEINDKELENFDFQDENIYKMMGLESFNPAEQKIREIDTIKNLGIQYRSVPYIGQLFSELSYSSLLKHDRATNDKESKPLPEKFKSLISSNVTFIDIPLNQDNSIYKVNKLFYSSYQTYCAILVTEIIKYFDSVNNGENWTIGLITPYKAQAILLNKLVTSYGISENVKVYSDTVHGFQGDECDIVFFVCNPNNYYYTGHEKSLLSKEYIYNVAISRAKDYLVILHPYSKITNNKFINQVGSSYRNNFGNARIINSGEIEKVLFSEENHIENNSYVSGHDNVNVFGLSEMKYFIKSNDTAIDIQLRDMKEEKESNKLIPESNFIKTEVLNIEGVKIVGHIDLSKFEKYKKK